MESVPVCWSVASDSVDTEGSGGPHCPVAGTRIPNSSGGRGDESRSGQSGVGAEGTGMGTVSTVAVAVCCGLLLTV